MTQLVTRWIEDGVGRVHLNDPAQRNALSKALSDALAEAVAEVLAQEVSAIVLTAEAPVFCSGGSLDSLLNRDQPLSQVYAGQKALAASPVPTIAVVAGAALGAGVNLPLACDVVLAGESAVFDPRFLDVGIHPGGAHYQRLTHRVGPQGAAALSLFGDALTGREAEATGLAWRCLPDTEVLSLALTFARRAAGRSRPLVIRAKKSLYESLSVDGFDAAFALELEAQEWSVLQPEFAESVRRVQAQLAARPKKAQQNAQQEGNQ